MKTYTVELRPLELKMLIANYEVMANQADTDASEGHAPGILKAMAKANRARAEVLKAILNTH